MAAGGEHDWDAATAIAACPVTPWTGVVWRYHARKWAGDDAAGSLKVTGRFNQGRDQFPDDAWLVLYTSLGPQVALGERLRHLTPSTFTNLRHERQSRLWVILQRVLDLCAPDDRTQSRISGLSAADICQPLSYTRTHQLAKVARESVEGIVVPSCTNYPEGNLIVFPDQLLPGSAITVQQTVDPDLVVDWPAS